jgi:predicted Zn-dependent peptidase
MLLPLMLAAAVNLGPGTLYTTNDAGAQLTGLSLIVRAGTTRETAAQSGLAALAAETLLFSQVGGMPLTGRVAADGGSVDVVVGPSAVRVTIQALPTAMAAVASDVAAVIAHPDTSAATVNAARDVLTGEIVEGDRNPVAVGIAMVRGSYYAGTGGRPLLGTRESMAQLSAGDVASFVAAHYLRGNVVAAANGVVDDGTIAAARTLFAAFPAGSEAPTALVARPIGAAGKRIETHRDLSVPFVMLGFAAPSLGDPDFAAMLVVRAMLGDITDRTDVMTGAPIERGLDIVYAYDLKPATFDVAINGALVDPSAALSIVQAIAKDALTKPFTSDVIRRYKEMARGQWALEALSLDDRAWQVGAAVTVGADPGAAQTVIAAIDRLTPADVQRAAKRYLQHSIVALILPRGVRE